MAISVVATVNPSTVQANTPVTVTYAVTNNGGATVNVTNIAPSAIFTGGGNQQTVAGNWGSTPVGTGLAVAVAASATVNFQVGYVPFVGTTGPIGGAVGTLTLGGQVQTNDGQNVAATTCTLTVNSLQSTYSASQQTSPQPIAYPNA